MRSFASPCAGLLALAFAGAAFAQSSPTTIPVKNASGATVNVAGQSDASSNFHYRDVMEGLNGGTPVAVTVDGSDSGLWTHVVNWPGSWAVTMASGAVAANAYALGAILDLGTGGTLHNDLQTLNTTAGAPAKIDDSSNTEVTDPTNHAMFTEPTTNGRFVQAPVSISTTSLTTLVAAQGAGLYAYVTDLDCENSGQYSFTLTLTNSASTSLYTLIVPAGGGWTKSFSTPLGGNGQMSANTALSITATQVGGSGQTPSIVCNVQGRVRSN